jgi:hypothetical protein
MMKKKRRRRRRRRRRRMMMMMMVMMMMMMVLMLLLLLLLLLLMMMIMMMMMTTGLWWRCPMSRRPRGPSTPRRGLTPVMCMQVVLLATDFVMIGALGGPGLAVASIDTVVVIIVTFCLGLAILGNTREVIRKRSTGVTCYTDTRNGRLLCVIATDWMCLRESVKGREQSIVMAVALSVCGSSAATAIQTALGADPATAQVRAHVRMEANDPGGGDEPLPVFYGGLEGESIGRRSRQLGVSMGSKAGRRAGRADKVADRSWCGCILQLVIAVLSVFTVPQIVLMPLLGGKVLGPKALGAFIGA